jgi:hypothetical protein
MTSQCALLAPALLVIAWESAGEWRRHLVAQSMLRTSVLRNRIHGSRGQDPSCFEAKDRS